MHLQKLKPSVDTNKKIETPILSYYMKNVLVSETYKKYVQKNLYVC